MGVKKRAPRSTAIDGGLFGFRTLQVIRLRHVFKVPHVPVPLVAALGRFARKSFANGEVPRCTAPRLLPSKATAVALVSPTCISLRMVRRLRSRSVPWPALRRHKLRVACPRRNEGLARPEVRGDLGPP